MKRLSIQKGVYSQAFPQDLPFLKYQSVLIPFVKQMAVELNDNDDKGGREGWLGMTQEQVMLEIYYHTAKLQKAIMDGDITRIREHAADVANMSMMALDICGGLTVEDSGSLKPLENPCSSPGDGPKDSS